MKDICIFVVSTLAVIGCARVSMVAPKEAIKLDVNMRLDVYQHVAKDVDNIEDMVSGPSKKAAPSNKQSFLDVFIDKAFADDGLGPDVQAAINSRKDRRPKLMDLEAKGQIGENISGLVELKSGGAGDLIQAENNDRMAIYKAVAEKNGTSIIDVEKVYAQRLQGDAPSGTPIETANGWSIKS